MSVPYQTKCRNAEARKQEEKKLFLAFQKHKEVSKAKMILSFSEGELCLVTPSVQAMVDGAKNIQHML